MMSRSDWDPGKLPAILKCMTLAVFCKNKGREGKRFTDGLLAARSTLVKIKFATAASKEGPLERFQLTAKGLKKNRKHEQDRSRHNQFDKLFLRYRADIEIGEIREEGEDVKGDEEKDQA